MGLIHFSIFSSYGSNFRSPYLHLALAHDLVHYLVVVLVELGLVVTLLIAQDPQALRPFQLYLKLLFGQ